MAFTSNSRAGRLYLATQSSVGTAATLAGSNCCRHTKVSMRPNNPRSPRNDKTGTLSRTPGIGGFRDASFSVTMDLAANGSPGVKPDCDPILQSIFGQAPTVVAGTSVAYSCVDSYVPITAGHFRTPSTVSQQVGYGIVISDIKFGFNDGVISKWTANGAGIWVVDSLSYSTLDSVGKGGIASAPSEPSSPVTNGTVATAFSGSLTLNSNAIATVKSGSLTFRRPATPQRAFGGPYVTGWGLGLRDVLLSLELFDSDDAYVNDLLQKGISDAVFGATLVLGNVAGNIWTFTINGLQISPPTLDDGASDRWVARFDDMMGGATSVALTNEISLVIT